MIISNQMVRHSRYHLDQLRKLLLTPTSKTKEILTPSPVHPFMHSNRSNQFQLINYHEITIITEQNKEIIPREDCASSSDKFDENYRRTKVQLNQGSSDLS